MSKALEIKVFEINENGSTSDGISTFGAKNCTRPGGFLWGSNGNSSCKC